MERINAIKTLREIGEIIAKEMKLEKMQIDNLDCGIWDVSMKTPLSQILQEEFGEMKTYIFYDELTEKGYNRKVEVGFRFSSPEICVFDRLPDGRQTLGSIELSDYIPDDNGEYKHSGDYQIREMQSWDITGYKITGRLIKMFEEVAK